MKNLKKVLALVLVVATLLTMTTIASAKYTDDSSVNYKEAVAVMSEIGVINGYTDNSFRPTANVTRAQMAKMVAYIVAGGEDVGALYSGANSFSDCTTHWAKGYIAYANKTGIVAGVGGGKFNPDGNVTGTQAAKMMLVALGYNSDAEGYTGASWAVNVLSDARDAGLLKNLESVNMSAAMTREQAAQLMFNALKADMVYYENGNINISSGDTNITIGGSAAKKVANTEFDYREGNKSGNDLKNKEMQLCEKYFPKLKVTATKADAFGASAHAWKYDKGDEMVFADAPVLTYTTAVAGKDLFKDVKDAGYKMESTGTANTANVTTYRNGNSNAVTETIKNDSTKYGGNGIVLNVYAGTDDVIYISVKVTYLAKVTGITKDKTNTAADESKLTVEYTDTTNTNRTGIVLDADKTQGFAAVYANAKVGDMLLITPNNDNSSATYALTAVAATSETGKITSVNKTDKTITFNGTKYDLAGVADVTKFSVSKDDVTVYFDANGYVIGSTSIASTGDKSLAVLKTFKGLDADGALVDKANVVFSDGTIETVMIKSADAGLSGVCTYTKTNDVYDLTAAAGANSGDGVVTTFASTSLKSGDKKITANTASSTADYYFTSDVKFIFVDAANNSAVVKTGVQKFTSKAGAVVLTKTADNLYQVSTVYVLGAAETATETSDELIYVKAGTTGTVLIADSSDSSGYKTYYTYDAYINGEKVDNFYATTNDATQGFYKNEKTDAGAYVLKGNSYTTTTGATAVTTSDVTFTNLINGNIMSAGNDYDVTNATVVDVTGNDLTTVGEIKNADAENTIKLRLIYNADKMVVEYIYVVSVVAD